MNDRTRQVLDPAWREVWRQIKECAANGDLRTGQLNIIRVPIFESSDFPLLEWLDAQPFYPKFYWQNRTGDEEVAVCGQLYSFADVSDAQAYLAQYEKTAIRLWGTHAFDYNPPDDFPQRSHFFLPQVELSRTGQTVTLTFYYSFNVSLLNDLDTIANRIKQLQKVEIKPLKTTKIQIKNEQHLPQYPQWKMLLTCALQQIAENQLAKVVMARKTTLTFEHSLQASALLSLSRQINPHCFHFLFAHTAERVFIGSSPERLYHRQQTRLRTEALAGTTANSGDQLHAQQQAEWLLKDSKNQHENLLVVDDICQRLQDVVTELDVMPAEVIRLRQVQHLRRTIQAQLQTTNDAVCLERLQPTAAVAGLPRETARQFIREHEPFQRGWYTGSVGYLSLAQAEFTVALRCGLIEGHRIHLYAGAGIVAGSDPEQEWREIENKVDGLRSLL